MVSRIVIAGLLGSMLAMPLSAHACAVGFKPDTQGFPLNPILKKLTVTSSKLEKPGDECLLHVDDEILRVNTQPVPGSRALAVMRYWKSIPDGSTITFVVRRNGAVVNVSTK